MSSLFESDTGVFSSGRSDPYNHAGFPDPFLDMASLAMPQSIQQILRWCEYIYVSQETYRQASDRVLSYFITDTDIRSPKTGKKVGTDEKKKYEEFFREALGLQTVMHSVGNDFMAYGNSFTSVILPIRRHLSCPRCTATFPLKQVYENKKFAFKWMNYEFHAKCPMGECGYSGAWNRMDRRGPVEDLLVKRWNPHHIEILHDTFTEQCHYIWKIPEDYRRQIRQGTLFHLERADWAVIEAVKQGADFRFDPDSIFHLKESHLAGIVNRGWGIPRTLVNFRQIWYVQVLRRFNETIALDYLIPFRVVTPAAKSGVDPAMGDPLLNMNMGGHMAKIRSMLRDHRLDPAQWHTLPFPVQYQALGGEAVQLAPKDLLDQGMDILLNGSGYPAELYRGTLSLQTAPVALRLFESCWNPLVAAMNRFLNFVANRTCSILMWEHIRLNLKKVSIIDDVNKQMAKIQLMGAGVVSKTTGLHSIGLDHQEEVERTMAEQEFEAEKAQEVQERAQEAGNMTAMAQPPQQGDPNAQGGQPAAGGQGADPAQGGQPGVPPSPVDQMLANMPIGPNQSITPQEMESRAQTLAQSLLGMPENQRTSEMIKLKRKDSNMHAIVKRQIEDIRQKMQTQGGAQLMQQTYGGT